MKLKFSILQVTFWCSFGAFTSFAVAYMNSRGMPARTIGTMLAAYTFCALCGQFFWGYLSDILKTNKKIFILTNVLMLGMYFFVYYARGDYFIITAYGLLGFVQTPVICNLDTWILKCYHNTPEEYGPIRSWASLLYALFMLFYGRVINSAGYSIMLVFSSLFVFITLIVALLTPDAPLYDAHSKKRGQGKGGIKKLLASKAFMFLLIVLFFIGFASVPIMQMLPLILKNVNGTVVHQGYAMFASSLAQVPFMLFSRKLARYSPYNRLIVSAFMYFISMTMISLVKSPQLIILFCAINGIGFGIQLPSMRQLVFENSPQGFHNTAQGLCDAVNSSLAGVISSAMAGVIIDAFGVTHMLLINAGVQLLAITFLIGRLTFTKRQRTPVQEMLWEKLPSERQKDSGSGKNAHG